MPKPRSAPIKKAAGGVCSEFRTSAENRGFEWTCYDFSGIAVMTACHNIGDITNEMCQGGDSNPYGFLHQILSLARLPIPPPWQM
jgi:hypothetical protein